MEKEKVKEKEKEGEEGLEGGLYGRGEEERRKIRCILITE